MQLFLFDWSYGPYSRIFVVKILLVNRMRGYLGYSMMDSWYGWIERKETVRLYKYPVGNYVAREWPVGWVGIDGDTLIEHELASTNKKKTTQKVGEP